MSAQLAVHDSTVYLSRCITATIGSVALSQIKYDAFPFNPTLGMTTASTTITAHGIVYIWGKRGHTLKVYPVTEPGLMAIAPGAAAASGILMDTIIGVPGNSSPSEQFWIYVWSTVQLALQIYVGWALVLAVLRFRDQRRLHQY